MSTLRGHGSSLVAAAMAVVLIVGACGGDDDSGPADTPAPTNASGDAPATTAATTATTTTEAAPAAGPSGLAPNTGRVTIGDTTWEAIADIQCIDFGVALGFQGHAVDDPSITILLDANTDDPSANSAQIEIGDDIDWRAGDIFVDAGATVPVVTAENGYGTGTATFVNNGFGETQGETAEGSYEFFCG